MRSAAHSLSLQRLPSHSATVLLQVESSEMPQMRLRVAEYRPVRRAAVVARSTSRKLRDSDKHALHAKGTLLTRAIGQVARAKRLLAFWIVEEIQTLITLSLSINTPSSLRQANEGAPLKRLQNVSSKSRGVQAFLWNVVPPFHTLPKTFNASIVALYTVGQQKLPPFLSTTLLPMSSMHRRGA